jgi:peptide/nickel transport system permease protein
MNANLKIGQDNLTESGAAAIVKPHEGMTVTLWRRFRRHPGAMGGMIVLTLILLICFLAQFSPYDPEKSSTDEMFQAPSMAHPFGTDSLGRDLFTRVLYGGQISIKVGLMVVAIMLIIGVPVGAVAGHFGGWVDNVLMRITDAVLAFPSLLILIMMSALVRDLNLPFLKGNNEVVIAVVIGILGWMTIARLVRATYMTIREVDFITAAHSMGASTLRIMVVEILPNAIGPIIVESTIEMAWAIMTESGLSFLGFGIMPPTPSWGNLLSDAQVYMTQYPWLAIFPGLMIFLTIISINYIGDGLRDAFDPHKVIGRIE